MQSQNNPAFTANTRTGKAITCAIVIAFTAAFYLMYLTAVLVVRQTLLLAILEARSQTGAALALGLAFDFVSLGILWRYLSPAKVFRFLLGGAEAIASQHLQAWRGGHRFLPLFVPLSPVFTAILVLAVAVVIARRMEGHKVRPKPAPPAAMDADALTREAIANRQLLLTSPCDESNGHSLMSDGN